MERGSGHLDPSGRLRMVDVGGKPATQRRAEAVCLVRMRSETRLAVEEASTPKGDVLAVAQVAGVQAAKRTPELVPGCHQVRLAAVELGFSMSPEGVEVRAEARGDDRTGFEMEALTACAVAALTIYDMLKGIDAELEISGLHLAGKAGGTSPRAVRLDGVRAAVLTVSDGVAAGTREDASGEAVRAWLEERGARPAGRSVVADDRGEIAAAIGRLGGEADLVVSTGGTGVGPRDVTPEGTMDVADRLVPGVAEVMRQESLRATPNAMLSRGVAALVGSAVVVNLPGSPRAISECLDAIAPALGHAIQLAKGEQPH